MVSTSLLDSTSKPTKPRAKRPARSVQASGPQLVTETKFMEQYRIGAAVHGGGDIAALQDGAHSVEVFTVGTDNQVWDFYSDPTSDTGMLAAPTALIGSKGAVGRNASGRIVLFASNNLALNYVVENAPGATQRWGAVQTAQLPLPSGAVTISDVYCGEVGGALYVGVLVQTKSVGPGPTYAFVYSVWDATPGVFQSTTVTLSTLNCLWSGTNAATAEFTCLDTVYLGYNIANRQVVRYPFAATFSSLAVATVIDSAANNRYYAVLNDGNLYQMVGGSGGRPYSWAQLTQQQSYRAVEASINQTGGIHLFTLGANNALWHLSPLDTAPTGFADPIVIQNNVALMTATMLDGGDIQLFAISTAQATMSQLLWQAGAGNWQITPVQVPTSGQVEQYTSYSTDVQILDASGSPVPQAQVQVRASSQTQITVNGSFYTIDPNTPATLVASAAGSLSINQQTNTLAIPSLSFEITNVTQGEALAVQQFAGTQERLATVTGNDLMTAKKNDGTYLLAEQYRTTQTTDSLAQACNQTMSLTSAELLAGSPLLVRQGKQAGVGAIRRDAVAQLNRITRVPGRETPSWQVAFTGGEVTYRELGAAEAGALLAEKRAMYAAHTAGANGFLDWIGSIGDFITGVGEAIISVVDTVVQAIGDAIHATITFIADGITYLFETVVEFVDQAFDLVEVFFAQVVVFFGDLFQWLGFLFNWNDILRTHTALAYTANQFLTFLPLAVGGIQQAFDSGIASIQSQITQFFDQLVAAVGGETLGGYTDANDPGDPTYSTSSSNNIIMSSTLENASGATYAPLSPSSMSPFDIVMQQITALVNTVENSEAFSQALTYMTNLGGSLDQIFTQLASALLRVVQGLVQAMIAGVQSVVDAILQLVQAFITGIQQMLNEQWNIPFVTTFYSWITNGASLTLLDLLALMVAVPSTLAYKISTGAAPFPDDASVAAFQASFTAQTMLSNSGFGASSLARRPGGTGAPASTTTTLAPGATADDTEAWAALLQTAGFLCYFVYGELQAIMDVRPTTGTGVVDPLIKTLTKVALVLEIVAQAAACPWLYGAGAPNCTTAEGVGAWFWIYESFGVVLDAGFAWYEGAFPENDDTIAGIVVAELYGAGHAVLTGALGSKLSATALASKIVLLLPECCKFLKLPSIETATGGWSLPVMAALDGLCIPVSGLLGFIDSVGTASEASGQLAERN